MRDVRRRPSVRLLLLVLLALLFQQVAIASYACPLVQIPAQMESMVECENMEEPDPPALCQKHCNPDDSTTPDVRTAQAPPVALPPLRFDFATTLLPAAPQRNYQSVPLSRTDPPATVRFCSLLI